MSRYLIEVPHEADKLACLRAIQVFLRTGSHFLTNADWGCSDNEHTAWIVVEAEGKEEARRILPPAYRTQAKIVTLSKFRLPEIEDQLARHTG